MSSRQHAGVGKYLARLRRRAAWIHVLRAIVTVSGAAGFTFAAGAAAIGPLGNTWVAALAWSLVASVAAGVAYLAWRSFAPLRGAGVARLLDRVGKELPSAARSAYELERNPPPHASMAMVLAHAERVERELRFIRPAHIVRWKELRHRAVGLGLLGLALGAALLTSERGSAGAYALVHPGERDDRGERVAVAFSDVTARLTYPSYLRREPLEVADPRVLEVPRGTSIEIRATPRLASSEAALRIDQTTMPMERDGSGRFFARFVARSDTDLALRLHETGGDWIRDASTHTVRALADEAPVVSLISPGEDLVVDEPDEITLLWEASDDIGLSSIELVIRDAAGEERRRRIGSYGESEPQPNAAGEASLDLAVHALARGESISAWLEVRDGDVVSGPNTGRSRELTVTLASEATRREERLAGLEGVLRQGLDTLADRLERDVPEAPEAALDRFATLRGSTESFVRSLREQADVMRQEGAAREVDIGLLRTMASRVRRLLHEERVAHGRRLASVSARRTLDERSTAELEEDVLTLDDLLTRLRIEDAAEIARELESIRREINSLLAELVRTDSPEARQRLLAAIARAQTRMRELAARIAQMGTNVPQEFMNQGEMPSPGETADALSQLREAVERGDLSRAERLVSDLRGQIDQLARALGRTEEDYAEARFGPRDRAMANAMESLEGLEAEQQQLAQRGTERRGRAARRAMEAIGGRDNRIGRRLSSEADRVRQALEEVDRDNLAGFEQDGYERARQRLVDTRDALAAGDLAEAQDMAEAAARDLSTLSRDLDLSALMFPGHEGETARDSDHARAADRALQGLRRELEEALPDVAEHLDGRDHGEMRGDLARQREASTAADRLAEQLATGPDGAPLSEDAAREVHEAADTMERAERALGRGDPVESARFQEEAARRLTELRERLEEEQQGGGGGGGGSSSRDMARPVDIPDADEFEGPMEMRRRLLDAMRESPPAGYEEAVRRYYEGLLR